MLDPENEEYNVALTVFLSPVPYSLQETQEELGCDVDDDPFPNDNWFLL